MKIIHSRFFDRRMTTSALPSTRNANYRNVARLASFICVIVLTALAIVSRNSSSSTAATISPSSTGWFTEAPVSNYDRKTSLTANPSTSPLAESPTIAEETWFSPAVDQTESPSTHPSGTANHDPLNVILFYTDDWNADMLGIADATNVVHTPNLDQLAAEGQWFPNSYVTTSVCWQSRATLLTGMYVSVHQFFRIYSQAFYGEVVQWTDTLFALLKGAGNYVGFVGKWHAPLPQPAEEQQAFDLFREYYGRHWMERDGERRHVTELNQADALEFLQSRPVDQNFALTVSFYAPHRWNNKPYPDSYMPQPYTENLYNSSVSIPHPVTATEDSWNSLPWFFTEENKERKIWKELRYDVEEDRQETMKRKYRMAAEVDDAVGAILAELKTQGVYENTLIIFTADNGYYDGHFGLAGKRYTHDASIRVPLLIRDPRMPSHQRGRVNDNIALNVDLAPTILAATGIDPPLAMQGRDLAQLYLTPEDGLDGLSWREDFFYEWNRGSPIDAVGHGDYLDSPAVFALIQKDWKYIYWPQTDYEQIFDLQLDPNEEFDVLNETIANQNWKYNELRDRYILLKSLSQGGAKV